MEDGSLFIFSIFWVIYVVIAVLMIVAMWRGAEINRQSKDHPAILGLVGIPDVILLLKDIENRLPYKAFTNDT